MYSWRRLTLDVEVGILPSKTPPCRVQNSVNKKNSIQPTKILVETLQNYMNFHNSFAQYFIISNNSDLLLFKEVYREMGLLRYILLRVMYFPIE